jgi:hypothetical protein
MAYGYWWRIDIRISTLMEAVVISCSHSHDPLWRIVVKGVVADVPKGLERESSSRAWAEFIVDIAIRKM